MSLSSGALGGGSLEPLRLEEGASGSQSQGAPEILSLSSGAGGSLEPLRLEKGASGRESLELSFQGLRTLPMAPRTEECRAAPGTRAVSARVALKRGGKSTTS